MSSFSQLDSNQTDLRVLMYILIEKRKIIFLISVVIFLLCMLYGTLQPTKYQANALLQLYHKQENSLGAISNANQSNMGNTPEESVAFQIALIRSKFILNSLIESLNLDIEVIPQKSFFKFFSHSLPQITVNKFNIPFDHLNKNFWILIDKPNHYQLYNDKNKFILEGKIGELVTQENLSIQINQINAPLGSKFSLKKHPEIDIMNQIRSKLAILDLSGSSDNAANKAAILQLSLIGTNPHKILEITNKLAEITKIKDAERKSIEAKKTLNFLYQQLPIIQKSLQEAEERLNQYRAKSGKIDIKLQTQSLLTHLSDINKQIEKTQLKKIDLLQKNTSLHPYIVSLSQEYNELIKQKDNILIQLKKLPAADQVALNLSRDVNVKNNLYTTLLQKINEQQVVNAGIVSDIHILSFATAPEKIATPNFFILAIASLFVGMLIGSLIILIWQIFNRRVLDSNWIEHNFNIENIITIPYSKNQKLLSQHNQNNSANVPILLSHLYPADVAIEKLRFLRNIIKINLQKSSNNILSFLSISKNVGQNFIATNLGKLLADEDNKVLIIDADIRNGQMHQYLSNQLTPGLTDIINETIPLEEAIKYSAAHNNLFFIPRGNVVDNPTELLLHPKFRLLLAELSKQYQYIIINSAPVLSIVDGTIIAGIGGFNLLVLAANMHEYWEVDTAIKNIRSTGAKIQGFIFNNVKPGNTLKYQNPEHSYRMRQIHSLLSQPKKEDNQKLIA